MVYKTCWQCYVLHPQKAPAVSGADAVKGARQGFPGCALLFEVNRELVHGKMAVEKNRFPQAGIFVCGF